MRTIVRIIDSISEWTGKTARWLCIALVGVLCYEVTARYVFGAPTIWAHATAIMLGSTLVALSWAYVHRHHGHIRIDIFYMHLSPRGKAIFDVVLTLLFFFPLVILLIYTAALQMWSSWSMGEVVIITFWHPPAGPVRTAVFLGLFLFALQGVAQFIRDSYLMIKNKPL